MPPMRERTSTKRSKIVTNTPLSRYARSSLVALFSFTGTWSIRRYMQIFEVHGIERRGQSTVVLSRERCFHFLAHTCILSRTSHTKRLRTGFESMRISGMTGILQNRWNLAFNRQRKLNSSSKMCSRFWDPYETRSNGKEYAVIVPDEIICETCATMVEDLVKELRGQSKLLGRLVNHFDVEIRPLGRAWCAEIS